jgi:hypothetical protein
MGVVRIGMMFKLEGERVVVRRFETTSLSYGSRVRTSLQGRRSLEAHPIVSGFDAGFRSQARSETVRSIWAFRPRGD